MRNPKIKTAHPTRKDRARLQGLFKIALKVCCRDEVKERQDFSLVRSAESRLNEKRLGILNDSTSLDSAIRRYAWYLRFNSPPSPSETST